MPPNPNTGSKNNLLIPLAIIVAGAMVASAIFFGDATYKPLSNETNSNTDKTIRIEPVSKTDHILGNPNAEVIVIEYSDLECHFCKIFQATMNQIVNDYKGKVAWVYRHFPIAELHSRASKEAEATECAAEQGGNATFWKYIDKVFLTTNSNNTLDPAELPKIAGDLGLNVAAFNECLSSGKYTETIKKEVEKSIAAGARGTPYSVAINKEGKQIIINGAEPIDKVKIKIDSILTK